MSMYIYICVHVCVKSVWPVLFFCRTPHDRRFVCSSYRTPGYHLVIAGAQGGREGVFSSGTTSG